jgi:molecular chaperone DnaK (HSP70)
MIIVAAMHARLLINPAIKEVAKSTPAAFELNSAPCTALSILTPSATGGMNVLVPKGSLLPVSHSFTCSTFKDNQSAMLLHLFEGERPTPAGNNSLAKAVISGLPAAKRGQVNVTITLSISGDGALSVSASASNAKSGEADLCLPLIFTNAGRLNKTQITSHLAEAAKNEASDKDKFEAEVVRGTLYGSLINASGEGAPEQVSAKAKEIESWLATNKAATAGDLQSKILELVSSYNQGGDDDDDDEDEDEEDEEEGDEGVSGGVAAMSIDMD